MEIADHELGSQTDRMCQAHLCDGSMSVW